MSEKRGSATTSLFFKLIESFGAQAISLLVRLLLARLLTPSDFGVLATLLVFIAVSQIFVQSGLNTALIQKKEADESDFSTAFWLSLGIAAVLYLALFVSAPAIGSFFEKPELSPLLRALSLMLFPGALLSVQNAVIAREMKFKGLMVASLQATVISGVVGVAMAYGGMGCWALVGQQLANQFSLACILLVTIKWRPRWLFSVQRVRGLVFFGWKLLASSLLETGYNNLRTFVIGKKFDTTAVGYYTTGKQFPELIMNAVNGSIQSVMLPVLAQKQEDLPNLKRMMRRSVMASSFLVMPLMAGLAAVATPLISLLFPPEWRMCVPFLQLCCIDFAFYPIHTTNLQAINAIGRSDVILRLELVKKSFGMVVLGITVFCFDTVLAIAWGAVVSTLVAAFVNAYPNRKLLGYGYWEQMRDVMPSMLLSLLMFAMVNAMNGLALPPLLLLPMQMLAGAALYAGIALLLKLESARYLMEMLHGLLRRRKS